MKSILAFLILSIVHTAVLGEQNKCYACHAKDADSCEGEEIVCPEGSACMTVSETLAVFGKTVHSISKRCARNLPCNVGSSAYVTSDTYVLLYTECCKGDLCNSGGFNMPIDINEHLGVQCPSCFGTNSLDICKSDETTICPGANDKCADIVGHLLIPNEDDLEFSAQGCISTDLSHSDYTSLVGLAIFNYTRNVYDTPPTILV